MSAADVQHFIKVIKNVNPECTWEISFHDLGDDSKFKKVLKGLSVGPNMVSPFSMSDLNLTNLAVRIAAVMNIYPFTNVSTGISIIGLVQNLNCF